MITVDVPGLRQIVRTRADSAKPKVTVVPVSGVTEQILDILYRPNDVATAYAIGTGTQLAYSLPSLLDEVEEYFRLNLAEEHWPATRTEMQRTLKRFYELAPGCPAALFGHSLCWTDQAMIKHFAGADLRTSSAVHVEVVRQGAKVKVCFQPNRGIWVRTEKPSWLCPPDAERERTRMAKITQARRTYLGRRIESTSRRQALGLIVDPRVDRWAIRANTFPCLRNLTYGLLGNTAGKATAITAAEASEDGFVMPRLPPASQVLDAGGILDVLIVKGLRFLSTTEVDEFSFSITSDGRVAYLVATAETPFSFATERIEDNPWFLWLDRNR